MISVDWLFADFGWILGLLVMVVCSFFAWVLLVYIAEIRKKR